MRIDIEKIKAKNFFSIGNNGIEFDYRKGLYRVTGDNKDSDGRNGAGKSVVLCETLAFALYGKPIRKINKDEMINSTNTKGCEVEITFTKNKSRYVIKRGIKPNFLTIEKDGELVEENANVKTTQKEIERIIGSDFQTFTHLLVMSNSYSTPFMDLDVNKKRSIIEDVLGISVLGKMNDLVKRDVLEIKQTLKMTEKDCEHSLSSYNDIKENNENMRKTSNEFESNKKKQLALLTKKGNEFVNKIEEMKSNVIDVDTYNDKKNKLVEKKSKIKEDINTKVVENKQYTKEIDKSSKLLNELADHPKCPLCNTSTDSDHVQSHIDQLQNNIDESTSCIENNKKFISSKKKLITKIDNGLVDIDDKIEENKEVLSSINEYENKLKLIEEKKTLVSEQVNSAMELINEEKEQSKYDEYETSKKKLNELANRYKTISFMRQILSDDGIKNYIIKKVIKYWNMKVNQYLSELNVDFSIVFDDQLESTLKSRNRDAFSYHNFSGGERSRIDVAILLAMLDLSRLQNNIDLNLMVIDELFDSAIDTNGREEILNLFKNKSIKENKSIYVISHSADLPIDLFDKEITIYKKNGFTSV